MSIVFNKLEGYDHICVLPKARRLVERANMNIWLKHLDPDEYATVQINAHEAIYFIDEKDMLAFKLRFGL